MRLHWLIDNNNKYLEFVKSRPAVLRLNTFNKPIVNWMEQQIKWPVLSMNSLQSADSKMHNYVVQSHRQEHSIFSTFICWCGPYSEVTEKIHLITFFARPNKMRSNCSRAHAVCRTDSIDDQRPDKMIEVECRRLIFIWYSTKTSRSNWCIHHVYIYIQYNEMIRLIELVNNLYTFHPFNVLIAFDLLYCAEWTMRISIGTIHPYPFAVADRTVDHPFVLIRITFHPSRSKLYSINGERQRNAFPSLVLTTMRTPLVG